MVEAWNNILAQQDATIYLAVALAAILIIWGTALWPLRVEAFRAARQVPFELWLLVGALAIRLINIGSESLWYDEAFTAAILRLPLLDIVRATAGDVHPPFYYLAALPFGADSETVLRLPAALFGAAAVVMTYKVGREFVADKEARIAAGIALILPGMLRYGQEARMYSLLALLLLTALWALKRQCWPVYIGAMGLALYTQNMAWFYLIALTVLAPAYQPDNRTIARQIGATVLIVLAYVPWIPALAGQLNHVGEGFWIPPITPGRALEPFLTMIVTARPPAPVALALAVAGIAVTCAGCWLYIRQRSAQAALLTAFVFAPPLLAICVSTVQSIYLPRCFIASVAALPILWSYALTRLPRPALVAAGVALAIGVVFFFFPTGDVRQDIRGFVADLYLEPGDTIYHTEIGSYFLIGYYADQWRATSYLFPYASDLSQSLSWDTKAVMGINQARFEDLPYPWLVIIETPFTSDAQHAENQRLLNRVFFVDSLAGNDVMTMRIYRAQRRSSDWQLNPVAAGAPHD